MQVCVKLFGTLPEFYPGSYPQTGLILEISENCSVAELVECMKLPIEHIAIIAVNGMLAKDDTVLPAGAEVKVFQPLHGG